MWFHEEVLSHRFAFSLMWMLPFQIVLIDVFHFLVKVISWHPLLGIQDWASTVFSLKAIYFHVLLCLSCSMFAVIHMRYYSADRYVYANRLEIVLSTLTARRIFHWMCHAFLGCFNTFCYLEYIGNDILENEFTWKDWSDFLFLLIHGLYAGAVFSRKYFANDWYLIKFNLHQQQKVPVLVSELPNILKESIENTFEGFPMYYIYYVSFGWLFINKLADYFGFEGSPGLSSTLFSLMSFHLLVAIIVSGTMMYFTWILYIQVFSIFASQRYEFFVDAPTECDKPKTLTKALTCSDFKLLQYLAVLDLRWLSQHSSERRKRFFAISQPGGHPHQWHSLSCICMTSLLQFLNNLKKLSVAEKGNGLKYHCKTIDQNNLQNPVTAYAEKIQDYFRQKPLFKYFFEDFPDTEALGLFTSCQLEIWTIEALGFLLSASYTEDEFGVIQQTLPKILCLLIDLKVCEEKLPLDIMSFKKYAKDSKFLHKGVSQRQTLKAALESTLYRIVLTFKTDIRGIFIPDEYHRYLEKYLEFKK